MRNNKGFTLMELLAAIFIGGMVMSALVLIWKTASTQTTQGQRQTVVRNQISNFRRQLYRDFYGADIITFPTTQYSGEADKMVLAGLKKAKRVNDTDFEFYRYKPKGPTQFFAYCMDDTSLKRYEINIPHSIDTDTLAISSYGSSQLDNCKNQGVTVLSHFTLQDSSISASGEDSYNGIYNLTGYVQWVFQDTANTTPIYVEINETMVSQGGY